MVRAVVLRQMALLKHRSPWVELHSFLSPWLCTKRPVVTVRVAVVGRSPGLRSMRVNQTRDHYFLCLPHHSLLQLSLCCRCCSVAVLWMTEVFYEWNTCLKCCFVCVCDSLICYITLSQHSFKKRKLECNGLFCGLYTERVKWGCENRPSHIEAPLVVWGVSIFWGHTVLVYVVLVAYWSSHLLGNPDVSCRRVSG